MKKNEAPSDDKIRVDALWEKLNRQLDKTGDCWLWTGFVDPNGYGRIYYDTYPGDNCKGLVHRLMYIFKFGHIPANMVIAHKCGNKLCCKPKHLILAKRRDVSFNGKKKFCVRGHKLPEAKMVGGRWRRVCEECRRLRQREAYKRNKDSEVEIITDAIHNLPFDK